MKRQLKVGVFVILAFAILALFIFLIGDQRRLWERQVTYHAAFHDVAGLRPGAPVRTGGVDIGTVLNVDHGPDPRDPRIYVDFSIVTREADRIREDTTATVTNKGLLGDKMLELSVADGSKPARDPQSLVPASEPKDMFANAEDLTKSAQNVVGNLEPLSKQLGDPEFANDIRTTAKSLAKILDGIANQDSVAHRLLFDPEEGKRLDAALTNLTQMTSDAHVVMTNFKDVSEQVKNGPGLAHALVYDGELSENTAGGIAELHQDLRAIREGNGLAHALIYGDGKSQQMMTNLNSMTADMAQIVAGIRQGKGTLGALLVDPSLYEDLKATVGNVERNQVLRALVRYSIKKDENEPHVATPPVPAAGPSAPAASSK